ncbi:MAG: hypothetical protein B7X07_00055 [Actinobacteria bacterium 21-64-8]|nr:MAG: hypothetical protein B7X07_00055 [Actinobacteria bacterium 21-64-8]
MSASLPLVRVVGLGPGDESLLTLRSVTLLDDASVARLRTRVHPAARRFEHVPSYDEWYESSANFEELYERITSDLASLAREHGEVVYAVPGSGIVAERTVELLFAREDVRVVVEPAVSVIDVACGALGRDPMRGELRVVDALASGEPFAGPGPLLILQTYSPEVLALVSDRLAPESAVTVLHHLGLNDQVIEIVSARHLANFARADHLTSLWVEDVEDAGTATRALVELAKRLRAQCPWDQEQTHASLTRHLLEEAYEALDALEVLVGADERGEADEATIAHVQEELGDLLFQVVFHAELGSETDRFDLTSIVNALRAKLIYRHPHVFGDVTVTGADDVAERWELLKRDEKGRASVIDGVVWQLPALTLYAKLLAKAARVGLARGDDARTSAHEALDALARRASSGVGELDASWRALLEAVVTLAHEEDVDLEGVLRQSAHALSDEIRAREARVKRDEVDE